MWVKAVEKAGTTDPDAVIDSIVGVSVPNLTGGYSTMMPNHHITKPVMIGEIQADGQMETVWQTSGLVVGDEWSDFLPDSKDLIADWRKPMPAATSMSPPESAAARAPTKPPAPKLPGGTPPSRPEAVFSG